MDLEKIAAQYKKLPTLKLKELVRDFADLREDVIPILVDELSARGEDQLAQELISLSELPKTQSIESPFSLSEFIPDGKPFEPEIIAEPLDHETAAQVFEMTEEDIIDACVKLVIDNKAKIRSRNMAIELMQEHYQLSDDMILTIFEKLEVKRSNAFNIAIVILVITLVMFFLSLFYLSGTVYIPGIVFIALMIDRFKRATDLKRISKNQTLEVI